MLNPYIVEMLDITKTFPGVVALSNVNFKVKPGEIHAICGENGAGKSTLMKLLSGVYPFGSYDGAIKVKGEEVAFSSTRDSEKAGIAIIYQELTLVKELTVAENVFLGRLHNTSGIVRWEKVYREALKVFNEMGVEININEKINEIGVGKQQLVEIAKAISLRADILILDEPTSSLTESETDLLFKLLKKLKANGVTSIIISHKINELFEIADRMTVIRDGLTIGTHDIKDLTEDKVIKLMVGRELKERYPISSRNVGEEIFRVDNFTAIIPGTTTKKILKNISFSLKEGEILGVSGLMGSGKTELLSSVFGFIECLKTGNTYLYGNQVKLNTPKAAITNKIIMVSEDRKRYGLVLIQGVLENTTLASLKEFCTFGFINKDEEIIQTNQYVQKLNIKTASIQTIVNNLSGGNQQKVVLSKCLMTKPKILLLDEPTRGVDVGAKFEIYKLIDQLVSNGTSIVLSSSDLPEIVGMSDRVLVMHEGEIKGEFTGNMITQNNIITAASGGMVYESNI